MKEARGYTNQQIADMTGIPLGTISKYFAGIDDESATYEIVRKLVVCLGGSLDELAGIEAQKVEVNEEKLTEDGYTETEIKAILRWAGSEISRSYKSVVVGLEARLSEKDERLNHRDVLVAEERKRAHLASVISYVTLGLFVVLFFMDFLMPSVGWIQR